MEPVSDTQATLTVAASVQSGCPLPALVRVLAEAIAKVDDAQVPPLAARLVEVLRRIGGEDITPLFELRDLLAAAVDRLAELQGQKADGKPLGTALAPTVRQLLEVLDVIEAHEARSPSEESPLDEIAAARARRRADREARASGL